jgi:hypothetical protein
MKTIEEFREFYATDLIKYLEPLEKRRKGVLNKIIITGAVAGIIALVIGIIVAIRIKTPFAFVIPVIIWVAIIGLAAKILSAGYVLEFKQFVIQPLVRFIADGLNYNPKDYIKKDLFMLSKIFTTRPNRYKGDDMVSGKIGSTKLRFSELNAEYESGSGKDRDRTIIFKGLFFVADFNKDFCGTTVVLPDTAERLFGWLGEKLQSMNVFRGQLIKLEDVEFEKHFVVYGADQIEARYILSPSLMKRIVDFKEKTGRRIYLSFVGSMVFVAISINKPLFEPRLFNTLLDFAPVRQYFEDLQLAIGIVDDLNLNTRIWSKQ